MVSIVTKKESNTYRPPVVDEQVEYAKDHHQQDSAPLGLESDNDHDTRQEAQDANKHAPEAPVARKHEAAKEKDEKHTTSKLDVHLAVTLIDLRQTSVEEPLAHPAVRQNHKQSTNDRQVAQEKVDVEDKTVAECLGHNYAEKAGHCILAVLASNDKHRRDSHCDHVEDQKGLSEAPRYYMPLISDDLTRHDQDRAYYVYTRAGISLGHSTA